jgi:hypothetical protein
LNHAPVDVEKAALMAGLIIDEPLAMSMLQPEAASARLLFTSAARRARSSFPRIFFRRSLAFT